MSHTKANSAKPTYHCHLCYPVWNNNYVCVLKFKNSHII